MNNLGRAIKRAFARKAPESDDKMKRSVPVQRELPEPQIPPCAPAWTHDASIVKFMREVFGYEWKLPEPAPIECDVKHKRDTEASLRRANALQDYGAGLHQVFPLRNVKPRD